jgi:hypothetical protein
MTSPFPELPESGGESQLEARLVELSRELESCSKVVVLGIQPLERYKRLTLDI